MTIQFSSPYIWDGETPVTLRISRGEDSIDIPLEREYDQKDYVEGKKNNHGYLERDEVNQWLTNYMGYDVVLLRSKPGRKTPLNRETEPWAQILHNSTKDTKSGFISSTALHIVNEASIRALRSVAQKKYDHEINNFDQSIFRPNILIDQEPAYCEEEMYEARIENMLMRQVGPCARCKLTSVNWDK